MHPADESRPTGAVKEPIVEPAPHDNLERGQCAGQTKIHSMIDVDKEKAQGREAVQVAAGYVFLPSCTVAIQD